MNVKEVCSFHEIHFDVKILIALESSFIQFQEQGVYLGLGVLFLLRKCWTYAKTAAVRPCKRPQIDLSLQSISTISCRYGTLNGRIRKKWVFCSNDPLLIRWLIISCEEGMSWAWLIHEEIRKKRYMEKPCQKGHFAPLILGWFAPLNFSEKEKTKDPALTNILL